MTQQPPPPPLEGFEISPEVAAKAKPGCIVRLHTKASAMTYVRGISETKRHKIPNDSLAIMTSLSGVGGKFYLAAIIFEHGICMIKACEIAEVVYVASIEEK